jgi:hypothetical protein
MLSVVAVALIKLDKQQLLLDHCKCCRFTMGDIGTAQSLTEQAWRKNLICLRSRACSTGNLDRLWCSWSAASVRISVLMGWKERSIEWIELFYLLMLPLWHQQIYLVKCVMRRWRACYRSSCCSIETALRGCNRLYWHFKIRSTEGQRLLVVRVGHFLSIGQR